jgi:hypothetical protein
MSNSQQLPTEQIADLLMRSYTEEQRFAIDSSLILRTFPEKKDAARYAQLAALSATILCAEAVAEPCECGVTGSKTNRRNVFVPAIRILTDFGDWSGWAVTDKAGILKAILCCGKNLIGPFSSFYSIWLYRTDGPQLPGVHIPFESDLFVSEEEPPENEEV